MSVSHLWRRTDTAPSNLFSLFHASSRIYRSTYFRSVAWSSLTLKLTPITIRFLENSRRKLYSADEACITSLKLEYSAAEMQAQAELLHAVQDLPNLRRISIDTPSKIIVKSTLPGLDKIFETAWRQDVPVRLHPSEICLDPVWTTCCLNEFHDSSNRWISRSLLDRSFILVLEIIHCRRKHATMTCNQPHKCGWKSLNPKVDPRSMFERWQREGSFNTHVTFTYIRRDIRNATIRKERAVLAGRVRLSVPDYKTIELDVPQQNELCRHMRGGYLSRILIEDGIS
jgi:hypothetical protein